jgi:hypothetical protein
MDRGFNPSLEQWDSIDNWQQKHMQKKHKNNPMLTDFEYSFSDTSLGKMGSAKCNICCKRAMNMSHGNTEEFQRICKELDAEYFIGEV